MAFCYSLVAVFQTKGLHPFKICFFCTLSETHQFDHLKSTPVIYMVDEFGDANVP